MNKNPYSPQQTNALYPIKGVIVSKAGLEIVRSSSQENYRVKGERGKIEMLSQRSLSRFLFLVRMSRRPYKSLITLTYGPNFPLTGKTAKKHLRSVLQGLRRRYEGLGYFWFLEFQERGAPHFHIGLTDVGDITWVDRQWLAFAWSNIVEIGWPYTAFDKPLGSWVWDTKIGANHYTHVDDTKVAVMRQHRRGKVWEYVKSEDGAIRYCAKYFSKPYQKLVPVDYQDVGRFWGISRNNLDREQFVLYGSETEVREMIREYGRNLDNLEFLPRFVFCDPDLTTFRAGL